MNNPDLLRRLGMLSMIIATIVGAVSLYVLFTSPTRDLTLAAVSVVAMVFGLLADRRAGKLDDRDAL